ncbi:MAG: MBL fold metallo-hydrolase, partial [Promethearchaeota archaeon]
MKITFLGTNGWYATDVGNTTCTLIESEKFYIVLDAGDGISKLDKYIVSEKPIFLLLSHLHLDHIIGFHIFAKFHFNQNIDIYGYNGTEIGIKQIIRHPYSSPLIDLPLNIKFHDIDEGNYDFGPKVTCKLLTHSDPCLGYRIEIENRIITYCTDTGVCSNLYELAKGADIFITECSYKAGQEEWGWPHLKIEEAADVALKSEVRQLLILTHFDASLYTTPQKRKEAENKAQKIFNPTIIASDDLEIVLNKSK